MRIPILLSTITAGLFAVAPAMTQSATIRQSPTPYARPDSSWISISGTVESVGENTFSLDYGKGTIAVTMADADRDAEGYVLAKGDKITVNGRIDDDFFEKTRIDASSIYVEELGTLFDTGRASEIGSVGFDAPLIVRYTRLLGTVTSIDAAAEEFAIDTGKRELTVEVDAMPYNPLDRVGYQKVRPGDKVSVSGRIDRDLFDGRVFEAETVITIKKRRRKSTGTSSADSQ